MKIKLKYTRDDVKRMILDLDELRLQQIDLETRLKKLGLNPDPSNVELELDKLNGRYKEVKEASEEVRPSNVRTR